MAHDVLRHTTLTRALSDFFTDMKDLMQKEVRLARAEVTEKVSSAVSAGIWFAVAGVLGLIALLLVVQAIVFFIASYGIALHWSSLIVAAALAIIAGILFAYARSTISEGVTPHRAMRQINEDIRAAKEQLS